MQTDLSDSSLFNHKSVMTDEILVSVDQYPLISDNKLIGIDATLGGGGHSYQLLKKYPDLKIIGLDHDPFARKSAFSKLEEFKSRIEIRPSNFANFEPKEKSVLNDSMEKTSNGAHFSRYHINTTINKFLNKVWNTKAQTPKPL